MDNNAGWRLVIGGAALWLLSGFCGPVIGAVALALGVISIIDGIVVLTISGQQISDAYDQAELIVSAEVTSHDYSINKEYVETTGIADGQPILSIEPDGSSIAFDSETLTGGSKLPDEEYWEDGSTKYYLDGTTLRVEKGDDTLEITKAA